MDLTPALCRLNGYHVTVWCSPCRRGVLIDLLPYRLGGDDTPWKTLFGKMRCAKCGAPATLLVVSRMNIGKTEDLLRLSRTVPVVGTLDSATGEATVQNAKSPAKGRAFRWARFSDAGLLPEPIVAEF